MGLKQTLGEIPVTFNTKIIIGISEFNKKEKLDIRLYFAPDGDEVKWIPTKKGVACPIEKRKELIEALGGIYKE